MTISQEEIFRVKQQLQQEIAVYEKKLQALASKQASMTNIEELAQSVIEYNELTRQIEDRSHVFSLLSQPPESFRSPYVKAEFFSYIVAAETVSVELVNVLVEAMLEQVRQDIQGGVDDAVDLIQAEFKEYIIPGKIIAERFDEIDPLVNEMNRFCHGVDPQYSDESAREVLRYAFEISITADTRMEPTIRALRDLQFAYLTTADRAALLDTVEEHLAVLRYDETKTQNIAMEKAVRMIEEKEGKELEQTDDF